MSLKKESWMCPCLTQVARFYFGLPRRDLNPLYGNPNECFPSWMFPRRARFARMCGT